MTPQAVSAEARTWIGTRVFHRNIPPLKGAGVDCLGLILAVGFETGALARFDWADVPEYGRLPNPKRLIEGCERYLVAIEPDQVGEGDVIALSWGISRDLPMHLAIRTEYRGRDMIVHAHAKAIPPRVVEHGYSAEWPLRFCSAWRYPELVR